MTTPTDPLVDRTPQAHTDRVTVGRGTRGRVEEHTHRPVDVFAWVRFDQSAPPVGVDRLLTTLKAYFTDGLLTEGRGR